MGKREKINFNTINEGKIEIIDPKLIAESSKRISDAMKKILREYHKKDAGSRLLASKTIYR
jgi:hypothetical protein